MNKVIWMWIAGAAVVIGGGFVLVNGGKLGNGGSAEDRVANVSTKSGSRNQRLSTGSPPATQQNGVMQLQEGGGSSPGQASAEPAYQTRPSKTAYLKRSFRDYQTPITDYKMENLQLTADGIALSPPADPNATDARVGILESPSMPLEHASNMVVPIWRGKIPEGSSINVEVQVSPDNEKWSRWYPVDASTDEISPTYPDGSPNPNFGAIAGTPTGFGLELYPNVKFRVTMATPGGANSPVLEGMDIYHTDSTDGDGFLANDPPPGEQGMQDSAQTPSP